MYTCILQNRWIQLEEVSTRWASSTGHVFWVIRSREILSNRYMKNHELYIKGITIILQTVGGNQ